MSAIIQHQQELNQSQWLVSPCPKCKQTPVLQYDPGVTFAECKCRKYALPDEQYLELARAINVVHEPRLKNYNFLKCHSLKAS
jgi:hypothetical protein